MLCDADGVIGIVQQIPFGSLHFMDIITAVFHHVAPGGFTVRVGSQNGQLGAVHGADSPFIGAAGFRNQFILRADQGNFRAPLHLNKADAPDDGRIIEGGSVIAVNRHLHLVNVHLIASRSSDLAHIIGAIGQVRPFGLTAGVGGNRIIIGFLAAVVKLELCAS